MLDSFREIPELAKVAGGSGSGCELNNCSVAVGPSVAARRASALPQIVVVPIVHFVRSGLDPTQIDRPHVAVAFFGRDRVELAATFSCSVVVQSLLSVRQGAARCHVSWHKEHVLKNCPFLADSPLPLPCPRPSPFLPLPFARPMASTCSSYASSPRSSTWPVCTRTGSWALAAAM